MSIPDRRRLWLLIITLLTLIISGCTLRNTAPESAPTTTPQSTGTSEISTMPPTRTPQGTFELPTSLPTFTARPFNTQQSRPTSVAQLPTSVPPPSATPLPISIVILSPVPGNVVSGNVQVLGAATHPQFLQYQVEYGPDPNPSNLWYPAADIVQSPVVNGLLGIWNTNVVNDGRYQVRLRVTLRDGTTLSTVVGNITVQNQEPTPVPTNTTVPRPIAAFGQSAVSGQSPFVVRFFNQSRGEITSYQWRFGDGGSSTAVNPTYTYRQPGTYTVTLTANGPGGEANVSRQINVQSPDAPTAGFTQNRVSGQAPLRVQFEDQSTGRITSRQWRFGDGSEPSNQENPEHVFRQVGTYNVLLTVSGPGGSSTARRQITVENPDVPAPSAAFTASATEGEVPFSVQFNVNNTDNIQSYDWRIDGETFSNNPNPELTFTEAGEYLIELTVTGEGGQDSRQRVITATRPPDAPNVTIAADPESGDVPLTVNFTSTSTGGTINEYQWDFGDGAISTDANPTHIYEQQGTFDVSLTVSGPGGSQTRTTTVTATEPIEPPTAGFDWSLINDSDGLSVQLTNQSSGENLTYNWEFGDNNTSAETDPQHTYADYGTYQVTLTVENSAGSDTAQGEVTLTSPTEPVNAVASANPQQVSVDEVVQFSAEQSTGDIAIYQWDFDEDGEIDSEQVTPTFSYPSVGTYIAELTVIGEDESQSSDTVEITVVEAVEAQFTFTPQQPEANQSVQFTSEGSTGQS